MKRTSVTMILMLSLVLLPAVASADDAAATFKQKCATCHGADGSGDTAMGKKNNLRPLGSAEVQKQSDAELTAIIADGGAEKKPAHAYKKKGLSDADVKALVGFIRTLKK